MAIKYSVFQNILDRKHVRQLFAYPDSALGFIQTHFCLYKNIHFCDVAGIADASSISFKCW